MTTSPESNSALVLVADDDADILELVQFALEDDGYEVATASDGQAALDLATELIPDLCVLDVMMPKLDGYELCRQLRAQPDTRLVPILLLTARTHRDNVELGREVGADEYMIKPFITEDLLRSVRSLIRDEGRIEPAPPIEPVVVPEPAGADPQSVESLVLVASDDESVLNLITYRLELGGLQVLPVPDADLARRLVAERRPDLCVLDDSMPDMNSGQSVLRISKPLVVPEVYDQVVAALAAG